MTKKTDTKPNRPLAQDAAACLMSDVHDASLTRAQKALNEHKQEVALHVIEEKPLTIFLNAQEIVTIMTIRDHPRMLALGYLLNQNMLKDDDVITAMDYDEEIDTIVIRTERNTDYEDKLKKKTHASGCALGTLFGDVMERFDTVTLPPTPVVPLSAMVRLVNDIQKLPSLYLKAGAIHGCVLCDDTKPLLYMEDVGRHNAVDKIAGFLHQRKDIPHKGIFYTTGRLTSEMIIKAVVMGMTILISRSGFTAWGIELADKAGLTMIGRARGMRMTVLTHPQRLIFDMPPSKAKTNAA